MPDPVVSNRGLLLSKFSQHDKPLNYLFINKINRIPFELDMDILLNFKGKNMPHNYEEVSAIHLARPIYFNWKYDSRGRSYSSGYGIDIQGNKTVRSSLSFRNKEVITDIKPLYIALANARGFDDWTWERRIKWAEKQDISYNFTIPRGTKYPEKYVKAVRAILDYREGNPSGFIMELDATASGIQIMAAITGCVKTANEVNLVDPKRRKDVYKALARNMTHQGAKTSREDVKYPCMTHFYNSLKTPRERLSVAQLEAFYKALDGLLPGAEMAMEKLNECWNPYAKSHTWVLPDGHTATFNTMTQKQGFYDYESIRLQYLYYVNEGNKESFRSLVPNIIHSIDGYIARQMVLRANFELVHVHDCFLFHPNYTEAVKSLYREILMELVTDYNINHIIESLTGRKSNIPISTDLVEHINNSSYAIS
jgi:DNA-directed RNA polymerase